MKINTTKDWNLKIADLYVSKYVESDAKILYHYTSVDALLGGIIVKNKPEPDKEICLWATNCRYMNDPEELNTGIQFANKILDSLFDKSMQNDCKQKENEERLKDKTYITSFSSAVDCLPMWGMYGQNGHGLALGFDTSVLKMSLPLFKSVYTTEEKEKWLKEELSKLTYVPDNLWNQLEGENIFSTFFENSLNMLSVYILLWTLSKNPAYAYEEEVRCMLIVNKEYNHKTKDPSIEKKEIIKYRLKNNLIVPYVELYLPKSALKEIWIGPTNDMERATRSLRAYLDHMGFNDVEIKQSKVPYRD